MVQKWPVACGKVAACCSLMQWGVCLRQDGEGKKVFRCSRSEEKKEKEKVRSCAKKC